MTKDMVRRAEIALGNDVDWRRLCAERGKEAARRVEHAFERSLDHGKTPEDLDDLMKEVIYQADLLGEAEISVAKSRAHLKEMQSRAEPKFVTIELGERVA